MPSHGDVLDIADVQAPRRSVADGLADAGVRPPVADDRRLADAGRSPAPRDGGRAPACSRRARGAAWRARDSGHGSGPRQLRRQDDCLCDVHEYQTDASVIRAFTSCRWKNGSFVRCGSAPREFRAGPPLIDDRSMSTAFADPIPPQGHEAALPILVADAHPELVGSQIARVLGPRTGSCSSATWRDRRRATRGRRPRRAVGPVRGPRGAPPPPQGVPGHARVVVAPDDSATAARQALNAGAEAYVPAADVAQTLARRWSRCVAGLVCVPRTSRRAIAKPTFSHREKEVLEPARRGPDEPPDRRPALPRREHRQDPPGLGVLQARRALAQGRRALLLDPAEGLATTALLPESPVS